MFNATFSAFLEEAQFTKEILGIGVTLLFKADYAAKGIYYQSFTCLSTGLERLAKLCLILDYYICNKGMLPSERYIRDFGHEINALFFSCGDVAENRKIKFRFPFELDDIHQNILHVLDAFADSKGRYSNINILLGKEQTEDDPIHKWYSSVDMPLFEKHISTKKKDAFEYRARVIGKALAEFSMVQHITEDDTNLQDPVEASRRTGVWEAVAPYRQLYTLQIIRFLTEIIMGLGYKAMAVSQNEDIPYFSEIFSLFYNSDAYFRSRKTWDRL